MAGFMIRNCKNLTFTGPSAKGMEVGFDISDSESINLIDANFETRTAVKGARVKGLQMTNLVHDDRGWISRPTPLAVLVRRAVHGDV